jgi:hypothetical protein
VLPREQITRCLVVMTGHDAICTGNGRLSATWPPSVGFGRKESWRDENRAWKHANSRCSRCATNGFFSYV